MNAHRHFIGGSWVTADVTIPVVNPSDGQVMAEIARGGAVRDRPRRRGGPVRDEREWGALDASARGALCPGSPS
jgi:aldehyde dehydrogenase (NAD+)